MIKTHRKLLPVRILSVSDERTFIAVGFLDLDVKNWGMVALSGPFLISSERTSFTLIVG